MNAEAPLAAVSHSSRDKKRHAFLLQLRPGMENAYDRVHASVPPELLALLKRVGISEYSIFRRERLLFLSLTVEDFEQAWKEIELDPAYKAWQKIMGPFFDAARDLGPGERFPMMREVFYLP